MTGYLASATATPAVAPAIGLALEPTPAPSLKGALASAATSGIPIVSCFPKVYTVADVWREWKEGMTGGPPLESLEAQFSPRWRLGNTMTVQFCRRKVVWDALKTLIARGRSEEEAIGELETMRDGQSLNRLVDLLRQRHQRQ
jgi:hypothetical protein